MKKYWKPICLLLGITLVLVLLYMNNNVRAKQNAANEFFTLILDNGEYELSYDELTGYISKIEALDIQNDEEKIRQDIDLAYLKYMLGEYEESLAYFKDAKSFRKSKESSANLLIVLGLSKVYMALGDEIKADEMFNEALNYAKLINDTMVSGVYQSYARTLVASNKGVEDAIKYMHKALELKTSSEFAVLNHLYLSSLYTVQRNYEAAVSHTKIALTIANESNIANLMAQGQLQFATLYYEQEKYNQAIYMFEDLMKNRYMILPANVKLDSLGYLADSYIMIHQYQYADELINEYIYIAQKQSYFDSMKELNWVYLLKTKLNIQMGNIEDAKESLQLAHDYHKKSTNVMFINTDLWAQDLILDIREAEEGPSRDLLMKYIELLETFNQRGIRDILYSTVRNHIVEVSSALGENEIALSYMNEKLTDLTQNEEVNYNLELNTMATRIKNAQLDTHLTFLKKAFIIGFIFICMLIGLIIKTLRNKAKIKQLNEQLYEQSITDYLTQVFNKKYLYDCLIKISSNKPDVSVMLIDIDYFKLYNDTYGHLAGDIILKEVAFLLKETFKEDMVFRCGGEEFCVISKRTESAFTETVQDLFEALKVAELEHKASLIHPYITISAGIHTGMITDTDIEEFLVIADQKLYQAKDNGRNRYIK